MDFNVASWGLMKPGMDEIRFGNNATRKKPAAPWGHGGHFTYFQRIPNNQGTFSLLLPPVLCGSFKIAA